MHDAVAQELSVLQSGDHGEYPLLLRPPQVGLEAHQIVNGAVGVVPPQLYHGVRLLPGLGVRQATGLQRPEAQGVLTPAGHDLHRHTALKDLPILEAVDLRLLGGGQLLPEGQILLLGQGAVDVVRSALIIAGGEVGTVHIHAVKAHQRSGSVEEVQGGLLSVSQQSRQTIRQSVGGQRPGGHHHLALRQLRYLAGDHGDERVVPELLRHHPGKALPVHRQSASGGDGGGVGAAEDQAVQSPQLLLQQAHGILQPRSP